MGDIYPGDYEFTVRGIFDGPRASEVMYFNQEYLEQSLPERRRGAGRHLLPSLIDDPSIAGTHRRRRSTTNSATRPAQTKTETEQALPLGFLSLLGNVKMFLIAISRAR